MSLLQTLTRLSAHSPAPFVAPLIPDYHGRAQVFTMQDGIPYQFTIRHASMGWHTIIPASAVSKRASVGEPAQVWQVWAYLEQLPRFYVIAVMPVDDNTWLAVPYNSADAAQRGWKQAQPKPVYIVNEGLLPFDVIETRAMGSALLYAGMALALRDANLGARLYDSNVTDHLNRDWQNAVRIVNDRLQEQQKQQALQALANQQASLQDRMRFQLEFMGAKLLDLAKRGQAYVVRWQAPDGHEYSMAVGEDTRIITAGICLAGSDSQNNLSSIVQVMEEAWQRRRPDLAGLDYDDD